MPELSPSEGSIYISIQALKMPVKLANRKLLVNLIGSFFMSVSKRDLSSFDLNIIKLCLGDIHISLAICFVSCYIPYKVIIIKTCILYRRMEAFQK